MATETASQTIKTVDIGWRRTDLDGRTLLVE
jgi:hypothetical protein